MRYLSVCSGIEAATAAWHTLGWTSAAFSEIEKFPCAHLAQRWPGVPNLGDMTRFREWPELAIDLLVGGTPCQAFSVAGRRESLGDERGNLSLVFCRIAERYDPELVVWENVPGVLSTKDNAFGCFLGELAGCDTALVPGRDGWTDAGVVAGPRRTIAWRLIDAQGFVPQRRSRVFVVAARAGGRIHPADVLFETEAEAFERFGDRIYTGPLFPLPEGVRGDPEAGGEAGKDVAGTLTRSLERGSADEAERDTLVAHALRADGFDASEDGRGTPIVVATAEGGRSVNLTRSNIGKQIHNQSPLLVFASETSPPVHGAANDTGGDRPMAMPHDQSHANAGGQLAVMTLAIRGRGDSHQLEIRQDETANAILTPNGGRAGIGVGAVASVCLGSDPLWTEELAMPQTTRNGDPGVVQRGMQVRRLTPTECERLMGLEDGYTAILYNGKPAKDGPRYRALGNSMVRDVMLWIGQRIEMLTGKPASGLVPVTQNQPIACVGNDSQ